MMDSLYLGSEKNKDTDQRIAQLICACVLPHMLISLGSARANLCLISMHMQKAGFSHDVAHIIAMIHHNYR